MKFLTFFTKSHSLLFEKYFLKSFNSTFKEAELIIFSDNEQYCKTSNYHEEGWADTQQKKLKFVIDTSANCQQDEVVIFCDVDIIFFKNFLDDISLRLEKNDFLCQRSFSKNHIITVDNKIIKHSMCSGFYVFKNNKKNMEFLKKVGESIVDDNYADQYFFNLNKNMIDFDMLSNSYPNTGYITNGKIVNPDMEITKESLEDFYLLHCNWTKDFNDKLLLMDKVYKTYYEKS